MAQADRLGWRQSLARSVARLNGGRIVRRLKAHESGATAVEFALIGPVFLILLLSMMETALVFLAGLVLDDATTLASRKIFTGTVQSSSFTKEKFKEELCANVPALLDCANGVIIDVQSSSTGIPKLDSPKDSAGNLTATGDTWEPGGKNDYVVVRALYQYPILIRMVFPQIKFDLADLSNGKRLLVSTVVFRNEPYQTSSQVK